MSGVQDSHNPSGYFGAIALEQQEDMWLTNVPPNASLSIGTSHAPVPLGDISLGGLYIAKKEMYKT